MNPEFPLADNHPGGDGTMRSKEGEVAGFCRQHETTGYIQTVGDDSGVKALKHFQLEADRGKDYGPVEVCHDAIAQAWGAILQQRAERDDGPLVDAATVALMFATAKIIRMAYKFKQDSLDDAQVYLGFFERLSKEDR